MELPAPLKRLSKACEVRPFTILFALILPIPGVLAIIFGDGVSQALTNLGAGTYSRLMGILFITGSVITLHAIMKNLLLNELLGMVLTAVGLLLYGVGVIIGLIPLGGVVAGSISITAGLAHIKSLFSVTAIAKSFDDSCRK